MMRKIDRLTLAGSILVLIALASVSSIALRSPFQHFGADLAGGRLIETSSDVGQEESRFMWSYRSMDLLVQAFAIFAASVACLSMLRETSQNGKAGRH